MTSSEHVRALLACASLSAIIISGPAWSQASEPAPGDAVQEIVVTASRTARTGFSSPTPTTVLGVEQIQARAAVNVADVLNEIPSFRPTRTPQTAAISGQFGSNFVDLRGLGTVRSLVLIDGRRHVPSTTLGEVDLNVIPSSLVERTEVVTGGASAAWGSDAVAGVVNLILKDKLQGVQGNISYGTTDKADDNSYNVSIAAGTGFAGGRGHVIAGFEYDKSNGLPFLQSARDWSAMLWGTLTLPNNRAAGLPARIVSPNVHFSNIQTAGGLIFGGPLANTTFLPGAGLGRFQNGSIVAGNLMIGGDNRNFAFGTDFHVVNPVGRGSALMRLSYDLTPKITAFTEIGGGNTTQNAFSAGHQVQANQTPINVTIDNAFLPAQLKAQMQALGLTSVQVGRYDSEIGRNAVLQKRSTRRGLIGLKGELGGGWTWDTYYQYGVNRSVADFSDIVINSNYFAAVDAVAGPNGTIVCRSLNTARGVADPGCVPFNIFGAGSPSKAAIDYVSDLSHAVTYTRQQVAAANIRGEPFSVFAGPVSVATGVEWRRESTSVKSDLNSQARRFDFTNVQPIKGNYNVKEIYAETVVPLARDVGFIRSVDLNGAVRRTDYSLAGAVTTWKFGATFEDSSRQIRLRATRSRDIRAPNLQELFGARQNGVDNIRDPNTGLTTLTAILTSGSTTLKPEVADTYTFGGVLSPRFIPGFRMSADYYNIDIAGVIATLGSQNIVDRCAAGAAELCPLVIRTGGAITTVLNNNLNLNGLKTSGVDLEADYRLPIDKVSLPGAFTIRWLGSYVNNLVTVDSAGAIDRVKQTVPKWSWNLSFNYALNRFSTNLTTRYIGDTVVNTTYIGPDDPRYSPSLPNSINKNTIPAVVYFDLSAQYTLVDQGGRKLVLYGVVNNVTDRDPPGAGSSNLTPTGVLYDVIGRFIRVGLRFNY